MSVRMCLALLVLLLACGVCRAEDERWSNFAEDGDLRYYMDQRSIIALPDNVYIFWVKSVPKDKDYFKHEYNLGHVSYMFTSYELDCAVSSYRVRGTIMYDKHRKEISKSLPEGEPSFEPVPPESMLELAQSEVCSREDKGKKSEEGEKETGGQGAAAPKAAPPATAEPAPAAPVVPAAPAAPGEPAAPSESEEPPGLQ